MTDTLAPNFAISVGKTALDAGVLQLVDSVVYESCDGIIDVAKIVIKNPNYCISDARVLAIGNEVSFFMGNATDLKHIGRVRIYKHRPTFGQNEMDFLEITGYTRDHEMTHNSPPQASPAGRSGGKRRGNKRTQSQDGRRFKDAKYSDAVEQRGKSYNFELDVDPTPESPSNFIQRAGMSDYDFIVGLANITGFLFWVDGDEDGVWTLHFKDPEKLKEQDQKFKFERNVGDQTTLFQFDPEFLVSETIARFRVRVLNAKTGKVFETEVSEDSLDGSPDLEYQDNPYLDTDVVDKSPEQAQSVQLYINDYSFTEVTDRKFTTEAEVSRWAKQWFRRNRQNFITARGFSIGVTSIKARQVHEIDGTGVVYNGDYYFSRVAHKVDRQDGYTLDFTCRKQTPKV